MRSGEGYFTNLQATKEVVSWIFLKSKFKKKTHLFFISIFHLLRLNGPNGNDDDDKTSLAKPHGEGGIPPSGGGATFLRTFATSLKDSSWVESVAASIILE